MFIFLHLICTLLCKFEVAWAPSFCIQQNNTGLEEIIFIIFSPFYTYEYLSLRDKKNMFIIGTGISYNQEWSSPSKEPAEQVPKVDSWELPKWNAHQVCTMFSNAKITFLTFDVLKNCTFSYELKKKNWKSHFSAAFDLLSRFSLKTC